MERIPPKEMAEKVARQLRPQHPDYQYLKHVFHHVRAILDVTPASVEKRLPELLTDQELTAFYDAVFRAYNRKHAVMIKLKAGLAAAKASGKKLGRPRGVLGKSKLDGREDEIKKLLALEVSKASIAKITGVDRSTLYNFIGSRGLAPNP